MNFFSKEFYIYRNCNNGDKQNYLKKLDVLLRMTKSLVESEKETTKWNFNEMVEMSDKTVLELSYSWQQFFLNALKLAKFSKKLSVNNFTSYLKYR